MSSALKTAPQPGAVDNSAPRPSASPRIYTGIFWAAYAANVAVVTANGLTFRFAELVGFVGGTEQTAGIIIGVATAVAMSTRLFLGQAIDHYGVRRLWLLASVAYVAGGVLMTLTTDLSWHLYVGRALFGVGLAGTLTCSAVHIQTLVPPERRTEILASLGSSGFVGMIAGALLGDLIFQTLDGRARFLVLFGSAALLGLLYIGFVHFITRNDVHRRPALTPPLHHLLFRYWPGNVLGVAFVMGMMLAVTTVFLTRFATHHGMEGIGPFFMGYAISAFGFRLLSRSWSRTVGRHKMILMGLAGHAIVMGLLPFATTPLWFPIPAIFGGFGHALLFPAVVSLGSEAFPRKYRGTGTTVVMGFFELGTLVSAPILGTIIDAFGGNGFTQMFLFAGFVATLVAVIYQCTTARTVDNDLTFRDSRPRAPVATGPRGIGPFMARHSPIEPAPREGSPHVARTEEGNAVRCASDPPQPVRHETGARIAPATRCR